MCSLLIGKSGGFQARHSLHKGEIKPTSQSASKIVRICVHIFNGDFIANLLQMSQSCVNLPLGKEYIIIP